MNSILLNTATRYLIPLLLALSLILLYRGHNLPGGGFIGGLMAATSIILFAYAHGWAEAEQRLPVDPLFLLASGLVLAMLSGLPGILSGDMYMKGLWLPPFKVFFLGKVKLGTPFLFDVGVYLAVIGFAVKCALALGTYHESWKS
jgi:multicomponent Na+:H+ antiporter subunit B